MLSTLEARHIPWVSLSDIGHAYVGALTGMDKVFVLRADEARQLRLEKGLLLPYAYRGEEVRKFREVEPGSLAVYPYLSSANDKPRLVPEEELRVKFPRVHAYLHEHKAELRQRRDSRRLYAAGKDWYRYLRPGSYAYIRPPKLIVKGIDRAATVGTLGQQTLFNGANCPGIVLKSSSPYDHRFILGLLNSSVSSAFFRSVCPPKLSGYLRFNVTNINRFPVPKIEFSDEPGVKRHDEVVTLVQRVSDLCKRVKARGTEHQKTLLKRRIAGTERRINRLVYELYGLTPEEEVAVGESAKGHYPTTGSNSCT